MRKNRYNYFIIFLLLLVVINFSCDTDFTMPHDVKEEPYKGKVTGLNDAYINLKINKGSIKEYNKSTGMAVIEFANTPPDFKNGSVITIDVDTMGYLRKVISSQVEKQTVTLQTEQAYLNELFVDKEFKLKTELIQPSDILNKQSSNQKISQSLTDEQGYIHPCLIIYYDSTGKTLSKSVFNTRVFPDSAFNIIDINKDFADTDLFGSDNSDIHFFISEGNMFFKSNAVLEFDIAPAEEIDENAEFEIGEVKNFKFYFEGKTGFLVKIALDLQKELSKDQTVKLLDFRKIRAKFMVGPVPLWISFDPDIYSKYELNADASLHADWGFESNHTLKVGGDYAVETDNIIPIQEYEPENDIYPLNTNGEINLNAHLELYPRVEVKIYDFFGPYAEVVPCIDGMYQAAMQNQTTMSGTETFLAWNSGLDLGLDCRIGAELTFLGLINEEFGPTTTNCYNYSLWNAPNDLEILTPLPEEADTGSTLNLVMKVLDNIKNPVAFCPLYISGDGSFNSQLPITGVNGEAAIEWTLKNTEGENSFTAAIYEADKSLIKEKNYTINIKSNNLPPNPPSSPNPPANSSDVTINSNLSWSGNDPDGDDLKYDIYFGKSSPPPLVKENISETNYTLGTLAFNTTYYWKVIAKDKNSQTNSDIWNFTTVANNPPEIQMLNQYTSVWSVTIYFKVTDPDDNLSEVIIDWGDEQLTTITTNFISIEESHEYNNAGNYTIILTAIDKEGANSTRNLNVELEQISPVNPGEMVDVLSGKTSPDNGNISLDYDIQIGKYEVTHTEYLEFLNNCDISPDGIYNNKQLVNIEHNKCAIKHNGSSFYFAKNIYASDEQCPVTYVSWYGSIAYCNWWSEQNGLEPTYDLTVWELKNDPDSLEGFRLPTTDEWEYAARGGKNGNPTIYAGSNELDEVGWYGPSEGTTHPVGQKLPNELGTYDMSGNVKEWSNSVDGPYRIVRGGSWLNPEQRCKITYTRSYLPKENLYYLGFRIVKTK